jgi:hypothetical protein
MKARYVIASLFAIALGGCTVYPTTPVVTQPVVTTPATTITPAPSGTVIVR